MKGNIMDNGQKPLVKQTASEKIDTYTFEIVKVKRLLDAKKARLEKLENGELEATNKESLESVKKDAEKLEKKVEKLEKFKNKYLDKDSVQNEIKRLEDKAAMYKERVAILEGKVEDLKEWEKTL